MISITLPSLSSEAITRAIRNSDETAFSPCQIVVVSPEPPPQPARSSVRWIVDRAPLRGANAAHEQAFLWTTGEHVLAWVDDHELLLGWDVHALGALKAAEAFSPGRPVAVGLRHDTGQVGTCFGRYYPYFPIMRRVHVLAVGGWLSGDYRLGFADVDLAMRVWAAGGRCEPTGAGLVRRMPDDDRKLGNLHQEAHTTPEDLALFLSRWKDTLGASWPTTHLRDFNVDVRGAV